jgi:hypothetical protein
MKSKHHYIRFANPDKNIVCYKCCISITMYILKYTDTRVVVVDSQWYDIFVPEKIINFNKKCSILSINIIIKNIIK